MDYRFLVHKHRVAPPLERIIHKVIIKKVRLQIIRRQNMDRDERRRMRRRKISGELTLLGNGFGIERLFYKFRATKHAAVTWEYSPRLFAAATRAPRRPCRSPRLSGHRVGLRLFLRLVLRFLPRWSLVFQVEEQIRWWLLTGSDKRRREGGLPGEGMHAEWKGCIYWITASGREEACSFQVLSGTGSVKSPNERQNTIVSAFGND